MDASELAMKMLEWERVKRQLDELTLEIQVAVSRLKKTQTVGNVRAAYSRGRRSFDYEGAITAALENGEIHESALDVYTVTTILYRDACNALRLEVPFTTSSPSVSVKLLE